MEKINCEADVRAAILLLEIKQEEERKMLKMEFHKAYESMKPINLIKSTFKDAAQSQEIKNHLLTTGVGLAAGYVSKALFERATSGPGSKLLGTTIMYGVSNVITQNPEVVRSISKSIFAFIRNKLNDNDSKIDETQVTEKETIT